MYLTQLARLLGYSYGELFPQVLTTSCLSATSKLLHFVGLPQVYSKLTNSRRPASKPPPPKKKADSTEYLLYLLQDKDNVKCVRIYMYRGVAYTNII